MVAEGKSPAMSVRNMGKFIGTASMYYRRKQNLDKAVRLQSKRETVIKDIAARHDGLRGLKSVIGKFSLSVYPQTAIKWNEGGLKEALGDRYPAIVAEDVEATVTVPLGRETRLGPMPPELAKVALTIGFLAIGFKEHEVPGFIQMKSVERVDEPKLYDMVQAGQVDAEQAGVPSETWAMKFTPLT